VTDQLADLQAALANRYTVERELGRGAMATVYLARDPKHARHVALKVLRPDVAGALGGERFLEEIRIIARLDHPHILTLIDSDIVDGFLYYVLPFVKGESLKDKLTREHQLPIDEAMRITTQVASALDYAHQRGVIHRDIKPENILIHEGEAMVADFGIALALREAGGPRLTETGLKVGTPLYMSPEQASGETQIDGRSDVYSLGCVLYEMLAGEPPYTGLSAQALIAKRLSEPVPHLRTLRDVPEAVEEAVTKALAKAPPDRFGTAGEFTAALSRVGSRKASRRVALAAIAVAVLVGTASLALGLRAPRAPPSVAVLYLDNLSRDTSDVYLTDGLTEEITARLGKLARLQVKSRNSVRRAQSSVQGDVVTLGRTLRVQYLIEGSLQRAKTRVRVSVRLIRAQDGFRIWGQEYDEPTTDVLRLEQDVAAAVATAIAGQLLPTEREALAARPTRNLAAYDHFLRGNYYLAQRTPHAAERAIEEYALAARLDTDYVAALFRLADAYGLFLDYGWPYRRLAPESVLALGVASANRALRKDSTSAEAWLARRVFLVYLHPRTLDGVLEADRRAISSDPQSAHAYDEYGIDMAKLGDDAGAVAAWRRGLALDPDQPATLFRLSAIAFWQRRIQDAIRWEDSTLVVDPGFHNAYAGRGLLRLYEGDTAGARADAETALRLHTGDTLLEESVLAMIDAREGDTSAARARLSGLVQRPDLRRPAPIQAMFLASAFVAIRRNTEALELLERVPRTAWFAFLLRSPYLDPLRSDVRFQRVVEESRPPTAAAAR
jgi:serine/threonine-protein kinase